MQMRLWSPRTRNCPRQSKPCAAARPNRYLWTISLRSNMSPRQLYRQFEAEFGVSPGKFYTAIRLQKAQSLLSNTRFPISQIAFACGYSTASWFSKSYKSFFGITPNEARVRLAAERRNRKSGWRCFSNRIRACWSISLARARRP
ncbi:helix-turn-helix domain-containing protein [Mesorhizobium sp. M0514]|uniref:helix-turn-helix domain-containing protein n=1 Tax=Mesorhizobium sp. M0514 TaxID=2956955 RepID=UPI003335E81C